MNQKWQINQRFRDSNLTGTGLGPAKSLATTELPKDLRNRAALHTTTKHLVQLPAVRVPTLGSYFGEGPLLELVENRYFRAKRVLFW